MIVFGRVTYQGMASYWPTPFAIANDPVIAGQMNGFSKIVISRTLVKAEWNNTRLINENVAEEIAKLNLVKTRTFGNGNVLLCYQVG